MRFFYFSCLPGLLRTCKAFKALKYISFLRLPGFPGLLGGLPGSAKSGIAGISEALQVFLQDKVMVQLDKPKLNSVHWQRKSCVPGMTDWRSPV